jgi:hypothetical protein
LSEEEEEEEEEDDDDDEAPRGYGVATSEDQVTCPDLLNQIDRVS